MASYTCHHPGIKNEYFTSGATEEEAWEKMRAKLERYHGGLASGMLANCCTYEEPERPDEDERHAVAWVAGSSNTRNEPPKFGKNRKHAEERLWKTHRVWNGQYVESAPLSRAPRWAIEQAN